MEGGSWRGNAHLPLLFFVSLGKFHHPILSPSTARPHLLFPHQVSGRTPRTDPNTDSWDTRHLAWWTGPRTIHYPRSTFPSPSCSGSIDAPANFVAAPWPTDYKAPWILAPTKLPFVMTLSSLGQLLRARCWGGSSSSRTKDARVAQATMTRIGIAGLGLGCRLNSRRALGSGILRRLETFTGTIVSRSTASGVSDEELCQKAERRNPRD